MGPGPASVLTNRTGSGIMQGMVNLAPAVDVPCLVDEEEFARLSGMAAKLVAKAVAEGSMFYVARDGRAQYPSFFADPRIDQRHVKAVCRRLGDLPGGSKWQFFTTPKGSLGGITPLDALQRGMREKVQRAAEGFAER
jgi:hypothetical protein